MGDLTREEIARLLADATPGPWSREQAQDGERLPNGDGYAGGWYETCWIVTTPSEQNGGESIAIADAIDHHDAGLIAAAPDLATTALAALDRLAERDAEVARLRAEWSARFTHGMICAATIAARAGDETTALDILGAAGIKTLAELHKAGADDFDARSLSRLFMTDSDDSPST